MNVNWSDELQALDRVGPSCDLWADALSRTESPRLRRRSARGLFPGLAWMRSWRRRTALAVSVALVAAVGAGSALAYHYLGPSPGFSAGLSSLNNLPPVPWPSSVPRTVLPSAARVTGISPSEAEQRLRLVQSGLSLGQEDVKGISLYALPGNSGSACIFVTGPGSGGICLPAWASSNPGPDDSVAWAAWGGDSRQTPGPLAVYGLVADNIRQVEADISGIAHTIPIVNNSFYADYDQITSTDTISLVIHFDDGTTRILHAPNPYGNNGG